jgi:formate dehydrogenase alpha subunit
VKKTLTICPYCGTGCALYLLSDDEGRLVGTEPSATHPVNRGRLCAKGWNAHAFVHHPERLTTPLIRRDGRLERASWEEALSAVVAGIRRVQGAHGPDAAMFLSSAKATNEENYLLMKLARAVFGTNNVDHCARLCHASTVVGLAEAFGSGAMTNTIACIDAADVILITGSNTTEQHPIIGARILEAQRRGARLIVADSRRIRLARFAELHIRHRNGTDVALFDAMMHVVLREGLEDAQFLAARTEGEGVLREALADWTPERAAAITGVTPAEIEEAARLFAGARNAMIVYAMGITQHTRGVDNVRALASLALLTGQVGRPGTGVNPLRGQNNVQGACDMGALPNVLTGYQSAADSAVRCKFAAAWGTELPGSKGLTSTEAMNAAAEGSVKAFFILGENPVLSDPDQAHVRRALANLDFLVVQDIFPTATTELADVVLPAGCFAEKEGTFTNTERRVQRARKATEPPGEALADFEILCALAEKAGYGGMRYGGPEEVMAEIASLTPIYGGIAYDRLGHAGLHWPCPDGGHPGTPILHLGAFTRGRGRLTPVEWRPPAEETDEAYPFLLTTGRTAIHWHTGTMTRRTHLLDREEPVPFVELNPEDARRLGVAARQDVLVATRRGEIRARAFLTETVLPGLLFLPFHFEEGAANALTLNALDPEASIPELKVCAASIRKAP